VQWFSDDCGHGPVASSSEHGNKPYGPTEVGISWPAGNYKLHRVQGLEKWKMTEWSCIICTFNLHNFNYTLSQKDNEMKKLKFKFCVPCHSGSIRQASVRPWCLCVCLIVCIIYTVHIIAAKHQCFSRHEQQMSIMQLTYLVELQPTISSTMHFLLPKPVPGSSWPISRPWQPQWIEKQ